MRTLARLATIALLLAAPIQAATSGPAVQFTRKPTAARTSDGVKIDFAVSAATDVAVYVQDAAGKVVCHLVAGVLGGNPPAPLKANTLEQSVVWDGKDDAGKPAGDGPFKVRVTLGTRGEFDSFLLNYPERCGYISAVAVGAGGTLYAFHHDATANGNMGGHKIKVFGRDGKHLKALTPFPADIAPVKVKALGVFQDEAGALVPHIYNWETLSVYPDNVGSRGADMPDYSSPAVDSKGRVYWLVAGPCLAVSSDDKYVYFAGLSAAAGPLPCVFRVDATTRQRAEVFLGATRS